MFPEPTVLFVFDGTEDEDIKMVRNLPNLLRVLQGENNALQYVCRPTAGQEALRKVKDQAEAHQEYNRKEKEKFYFW